MQLASASVPVSSSSNGWTARLRRSIQRTQQQRLRSGQKLDLLFDLANLPMSAFDLQLESVLQAMTAGLIVGCIYGVMCAGLSIIFGVMRVINFAQGEFF